MEESWTILKVLQWTTGYFGRKGIEQPRANAEVLLAFVLGMERIDLYLRHDQPLTASELSRYREVVRRRALREPTQYITRRQEFWSLEFEVDPAVLIPRPETELLVEKALDLVGSDPKKVLEIGTGSGAISVALAHECGSVQILATDKSPEALRVARRNARRHGVLERISFVAADLFEGLHPGNARFHLVVGNPPYVSDEEYADLPEEISGHEPAMALLGKGPRGLDVVRRILQTAGAFLTAPGDLLLEIGRGQAEILEQEPKLFPGLRLEGFLRDHSGILRIMHLRKVIG
ncbi:MAG TPA: peptide chain release factor N(5)-glutamine methyltransferase [Syntrophobacteraceae bacterium]|nr:peptide chain release factor N(5)-glutamine methyltransferase [Syntrophobacteraceae bacterium]